ncbi:NACHT and WD repeat domain-containing protein 2 isoform X1 [Lates japonicus]|uniref:NACHT and WD repeat domain-containing protein 2 isoform X1 n=1 Tax=Lates japonicus TaxID=270547 RepID=A0AAD3NQR1_LATJO|nr:NACHT and WD repeat domain-containing protein 2 isoform X1 [Lates japonicus]
MLSGLVGEKYGSIRVPGEVESAEFEMILDAAVEAGLDTHILEEWYCRDENSVPPAYYLKPKAQMLKNYQNSMESSSAAKTKNDKAWRNVSEEIKRIFRTAVLQLQEKGTMKSAQAKKFLCSALEDELDFALGKQTPAFLRKCVCYIRKISNFDRFAKLPEMARYMDIVVSGDRIMRNQEAYERLLKVRDEFIPTVVAASNLRVYSSVTHCDMKLGYSQEVESHYVEGLCKQFYEDMVDIIQATVQQNFDTETDPLYDEILQHLSLCKNYAALYEYKAESLDYVQEYLMPSKGSRMSPLVVYGGPCTGKTLLLSEVAQQARSLPHALEQPSDTDEVSRCGGGSHTPAVPRQSADCSPSTLPNKQHGILQKPDIIHDEVRLGELIQWDRKKDDRAGVPPYQRATDDPMFKSS